MQSYQAAIICSGFLILASLTLWCFVTWHDDIGEPLDWNDDDLGDDD